MLLCFSDHTASSTGLGNAVTCPISWRKCSVSTLSNLVATRHEWLLSTWNVASKLKKLKFKLYYFSLNSNSDMGLGTIIWICKSRQPVRKLAITGRSWGPRGIEEQAELRNLSWFMIDKCDVLSRISVFKNQMYICKLPCSGVMLWFSLDYWASS